MNDKRRKDANWEIKTNPDGTSPTDDATLAVLMDIRDELKKLNNLLHCHNFITLPLKIEAIRRNTTKPKRKK